ncbi:MAG TPA: GTPase, partial [Gaiellaceae bacterium]|nr:GTPase [Gaiellaceae bacterium]
MKGRLDERLAALGEAARLAEGRLDADAVVRAQAVVARAGERLGLGLESTVVALAGPTGAGKSRLFNALAGEELADVGRRRPTTAAGQAAVWGDGADPLLDWLEIPRRHRLAAADGLDGLVLLDLPDFDSVETAHRLEVDRVVGLADLVAWVVEPQKYADATLHDRYLRPLASHAEAMAVVLNQADLLSPHDVDAWRADVARLLAEDGLRGAPLVVVSAETGEGLGELRRLLAERVQARDAALRRLAADVDHAADALGAACGEGRPAGIRREDRRRLAAALEDAAGVPAVLRAVEAAHRRRGALACGWPPVRWVRRLRPDPLRRFRLPETPQPAVRTSLPPPT